MNRFLLSSHLLSYPTEELVSSLSPRSPLETWLLEEDLYTVQEHYVEMFDRSAKCSLYLFEHIHGDSKERGSALINLKELYANEGCYLESPELPDYLPVFLEFLSLLDESKANDLLVNVNHILSRIAANLEKRNSPYHDLVRSLVTGEAKPIQDKPEEEIDKVWEEEPVTFNTKSCQPRDYHS